MIIRTARAKRGGGHKSTGRRAAASGGAPAQSRRKPGSPGFSGYEYQIEVTVWVALDLMLAKAATDQVAIEPRSEEDLEAPVKDPPAASLGLTASGARLDLILQAKTRSGSPWPTTGIADVLLGKDADAAEQGARRSRPLAMLKDDLQRRYIFVTNEASAERACGPMKALICSTFPRTMSSRGYTRDNGGFAKRQNSVGFIALLR